MTAVPIVALAGHVDHGKSGLVAVLTGQTTDRRPVERERGLTVDLGHLTLHDDGHVVAALVDVPGHVDYLHNTVVGLAAATHALLVVAADDGWMPQTEDHVRAIRALGLPVAAVAVTKVDLVDDHRVDEVRSEITRTLAGHGLPVPPIVATSAFTGQGRRALHDRLRSLVVPAGGPGPALDLWVDRVFDVAGRGQVATGTLRGGELAVGDVLVVAGSGKTVRVRELQQHGHTVAAVSGPIRVGAALTGAPVGRGNRLLATGHDPAASSTRVDVRCTRVGARPVTARGAWLLQVGAARTAATVLPYDLSGRDPAPFLELSLQAPLPLLVGDRGVLVDAGSREVVAGVEVLDPLPPSRPRGRRARTARGRDLAEITPSRPLTGLTAADGGATHVNAARRRTGRPDLVGELGDWLVTAELRADLTDRLSAHAATAIATDDGDGTVGVALDAAVAAVADETGLDRDLVWRLARSSPDLRVHDHRLVPVSLAPDLDRARTEAAAQLRTRLRNAPLQPPPLSAAARAAGVTAPDLDRLVARGVIVRAGDFGVLPEAVDVVVARLRALEDRCGPFTVAQARDALGLTRRHTVPWLELLDRLGHTSREGDRRTVTASSG